MAIWALGAAPGSLWGSGEPLWAPLALKFNKFNTNGEMCNDIMGMLAWGRV